jgi:1-phosphofructokinase family hexose kinase
VSAKILVVALNPSIDVEWVVPDVRWEEKNSIISERRWPGGKGVNVARWLKHLGVSPRLLLPAGGETGQDLRAGLRTLGLSTHAVRLREPTRANIIVTTSKGGQLRFNPIGPNISKSEWKKILESTRSALRSAKIAIFSGSLPRGVPRTAYRQLISMAKSAGVTPILDCDGPSLASAVDAQPFLVKPNESELAQWRGRVLATKAQIVEAAFELSCATRNWVLVSRGHRGGLLVNSGLDQLLEAPARKITVVNTVGAGDAMLAGTAKALSEDRTPAEWLLSGVACGTAAASCRAGMLPSHNVLKLLLPGGSGALEQ